MSKGEKGVTMIAFVVTVVLVVIILVIAGFIANNFYKKSKLETIMSQMQTIQEKSEELYNEHLYKGTKLLGEKIKIDSDNNPETEEETWYKLSNSDLEKLEVNFKVEGDAFYCVKYDLTQEENKEGVDKEKLDPVDVYYSEGYKSPSGNMYYTLSKLKDLES